MKRLLGLKLVKQKRSIPVIVVDHVSEKPTSNEYPMPGRTCASRWDLRLAGGTACPTSAKQSYRTVGQAAWDF